MPRWTYCELRIPSDLDYQERIDRIVSVCSQGWEPFGGFTYQVAKKKTVILVMFRREIPEPEPEPEETQLQKIERIKKAVAEEREARAEQTDDSSFDESVPILGLEELVEIAESAEIIESSSTTEEEDEEDEFGGAVVNPS